MSIRTIQYQTAGTCCKLMNVSIDGSIIKDVEFLGGCPGNLEGIRHLITGMNVDETISKLQGIRCGGKLTSCPDQLAKCLLEYKAQSKLQEAAK